MSNSEFPARSHHYSRYVRRLRRQVRHGHIARRHPIEVQEIAPNGTNSTVPIRVDKTFGLGELPWNDLYLKFGGTVVTFGSNRRNNLSLEKISQYVYVENPELISDLHFFLKTNTRTRVRRVKIHSMSSSGTYVNGDLLEVWSNRVLFNGDRIAVIHPSNELFTFWEVRESRTAIRERNIRRMTVQAQNKKKSSRRIPFYGTFGQFRDTELKPRTPSVLSYGIFHTLLWKEYQSRPFKRPLPAKKYSVLNINYKSVHSYR